MFHSFGHKIWTARWNWQQREKSFTEKSKHAMASNIRIFRYKHCNVWCDRFCNIWCGLYLASTIRNKTIYRQIELKNTPTIDYKKSITKIPENHDRFPNVSNLRTALHIYRYIKVHTLAICVNRKVSTLYL